MMPYEIKQDGDGDKPWCVYLKSDGSRVGCASSEDKAQAMIAAIEASEHSVKAAGDYTLDVLGVPHGEDRQGQTFDARTDLGQLTMVPVVYWHGFDQQNQPRVETIGWAVRAERNDAGQWYRVTLDKAKAIAQKIFSDAAKGLVRASSDAIAHLVRPAGILGKPGYVSSWPVAALSLMDEATYQLAVNPRAIAMPAVRALFDEALSNLSDLERDEAESGEVVPAEADATEAVEAVKAGAVFAKRNRERIQKMRELLDEMADEFPEETGAGAATTAAATGNQETQNLGAPAQATKADDILSLEDTLLAQIVGKLAAEAVAAQLEQLK